MAAVVATVNVEDPEPVTEVGANVPVAPVGNPLTVKFTSELNPFAPETVGVNVVVEPWITDCELGVVAIKKKKKTFTTKVTVEVLTRLPLVPVIVSV